MSVCFSTNFMGLERSRESQTPEQRFERSLATMSVATQKMSRARAV